MAKNLTNRVQEIKSQIEDSVEGKLSYWSAFFILSASLFVLIKICTFLWPITEIKIDNPDINQDILWYEAIKEKVNKRSSSLSKQSIIGNSTSKNYTIFAAELLKELELDYKAANSQNISDYTWNNENQNEGQEIEFRVPWYGKFFIESVLRVYFIFISCWKIWIFSLLVGFFLFGKKLRPKKHQDILGILDRGSSPFYSGIYGPYIPNNNISGTDLSAPGLACPNKVGIQTTKSSKIFQILEKFSASNKTNLELGSVILAYKHYPSIVDIEKPSDSEEVDETNLDKKNNIFKATFITQPGDPLEISTNLTLSAALEAHNALQKINISEVLKKYGDEKLEQIENNTKSLNISNLAKLLISTLTPDRAEAIKNLSSKKIATAVLSLEAGKILVFKKESEKFTQISLLPHLQSRAILHSIVPYHTEYNGSERLIIRQAILSSRRHGDFGRAFLPEGLDDSTKALRDWLELIYIAPDKREEYSKLIELDGLLDELHYLWRVNLSKLVKEVSTNNNSDTILKFGHVPNKGIAYRSVVLIPIKSLIDSGLSNLDLWKKRRIEELIVATKDLQATLSTAARLPGFKRQALEAQALNIDKNSLIKIVENRSGGEKLIKNWLTIRRMLTKYNWLSTRVGDYSVPIEGLITAFPAIYESTKINQNECEIFVPLRARRFKELFGNKWDLLYYSDSPAPNEIDVATNTEELQNIVKLAASDQSPNLGATD